MAFSFPTNGIIAGSFTSAVGSLTLTFPGGFSTSAGDTIVVMGSYANTATGFSITAPTDSQVDSGLGLVNDTNVGSIGFAKMFPSVAAGRTAVTLTWSGTHPGFGDAFAWVVRGGTNVVFDKVVQNSSGATTGTAASSGSTGTLSSATEAGFAYGFCDSNYTGAGLATGWTSDGLTAGTDDIGMHQVISATTALNATATLATGHWHMFCATIMSSSASTPTWGWQPRVNDERLLPVSRLPDQGLPFFRPSQIPVPQQWLPLTGEDRERLPPIQRIDWTPPTFQPSQIPVPQRWQPTTGQEDRLPNPNRIRTDWAPQWFVQSPSPVPTSWLPTTAEREQRPPLVSRTDWAVPFVKPPAAAVPIAGMAWLVTQEQMRPPPAPDQYYFGWSPQVPIVLITYMAQTNADDFNPLPRPVPGEAPTTWPPHPPFAAVSTIAGMAWWRPADDARLIPGFELRRPDDFVQWFVPSPSQVPVSWLPATGAEDRPPAQKRPPDEPGAFFRSPASVPPTWLSSWYDQAPYITKSDQYGLPFIATPPVPPVGIAGMAWWRQTEVYFNVPPPQGDYHPAWDPQFIVQIVPPFVEEYSNDFMSSVGRLGTIERNP